MTAARMAQGWSWLMVVVAGGLVVVLPPLARMGQEGYCENIDHPGPCASAWDLAGPGLAFLAVGVWGLVAGRALRQGRPWGRPVVIVTFSLLALASFVGLVGATQSEDPGAAVLWLFPLAYCAITATFAATDRPR